MSAFAPRTMLPAGSGRLLGAAAAPGCAVGPIHLAQLVPVPDALAVRPQVEGAVLAALAGSRQDLDPDPWGRRSSCLEVCAPEPGDSGRQANPSAGPGGAGGPWCLPRSIANRSTTSSGRHRLADVEALPEVAVHVLSRASWVGRSMPSATVRSPRLCARSMIAATRNPPWSRRPSSSTNSLSILSTSTGQLAQPAERRVAGAEVVDGDPYAEGLERPQPLDGRLDVGHDRALGDLQRDPRRHRCRCAASTSPTSPPNSARRSWRCETLMLTDRPGPATVDQSTTCRQAALQHPQPERHDEPGLLGKRDEGVRSDQATLRVLPAHQRLDPYHPAGRHRHDRLVVQRELAVVQGALQVGPQVQPVQSGGVHVRLEDGVAALAVGLHDVHRGVGVAQQLLGGGRGVGGVTGEREADARLHEHLLALDDQRLPEHSKSLRRLCPFYLQNQYAELYTG